jgi:hypothetical protein
MDAERVMGSSLWMSWEGSPPLEFMSGADAPGVPFSTELAPGPRLTLPGML